jgi:hypothetical protein
MPRYGSSNVIARHLRRHYRAYRSLNPGAERQQALIPAMRGLTGVV